MVERTQIYLSQILTQTEGQAKEFKRRILAGEDFATLAKRFSACKSGMIGGVMGSFIKGQWPPQVDKVIWFLSIGEVSDPIKTQYGWHIFKRTG